MASHWPVMLLAPPVNLFADVPKTELAEVIELWQDAFEWSYYDSVLKGLLATPQKRGLESDIGNDRSRQ